MINVHALLLMKVFFTLVLLRIIELTKPTILNIAGHWKQKRMHSSPRESFHKHSKGLNKRGGRMKDGANGQECGARSSGHVI